MSLSETLKAIRRKPDLAPTSKEGASSAIGRKPIRMSGTVDYTNQEYERNPQDAQLDNDNPVGRTGNDWTYPDYPRGRFDVDTVNGDRLQDQTARFLHTGEAPGRIPHGWNDRIHGKLGRNITGNPAGDIGFSDVTSGDPAGGIGDMMYVPHTPTPRGTTVARPYLRTIDDSAAIPGIFVADATRR